jgi:hypothetical protein
MPRFEGDVFRFGTAIVDTPEKGAVRLDQARR